MHRLLTSSILLLLLASTALPARAIVTNGDFESGDQGWNSSIPTNWTVSFETTGGFPDGYARIESPFGNSEGAGYIYQDVSCGDPAAGSVCLISLDYNLEQVDASDQTGRLVVLVDGEVAFATPFEPSQGWQKTEFRVPCGVHKLSLGLEVLPGNNGWAACFDNVTAECEQITPIEPSTWSSLKSIYR